MPASINQQLQDLLDEEAEQTRYQDLCLILRRASNQETILWAGGRWDRLDRCWSPQEPEVGKIIDLHEGQVELATWYAGWLRDFREGYPRDITAALAIGDRRGGKTFLCTLLTLATLIDVPLIGGAPSIGWLVSVSHAERDELDREIKTHLPSTWYRYREWPKHYYTLAHGPTLTNVSADDPDTLKRGRADIVCINEAGKMPKAVPLNAIGGTSDKGGITLLASNPPTKEKARWILDLRDKADDAYKAGKGFPVRFFSFSSRLNTSIDQEARSRVGDILRILDPRLAQADDEGLLLRIGDYAYWEWSKDKHLRQVPQLGDITREYTRKRYGTPYAYVGGADFQGSPHHAATLWKVYGTLQDPILWAVDEFVAELSTEDDLLDDVEERYSPQDILWVGDASGQWQDGRHNRNGRDSFTVFKARGWHIVPPAEKKSAKGKYSKNPPVEQRVKLVNKLLSDDKVKVSPSCTKLTEALKECPLVAARYGSRPSGFYSHITDTAGYVAWYLLPRPTPARSGQGIGATTIEIQRPSIWG